jgi:hypothetical protein
MPPPSMSGIEAQPLTITAHNSAAIWAKRIASALADDVDQTDNGQARRDDGVGLLGVELQTHRRGDQNEAAPSGVFGEFAEQDVDDVHAPWRVSKPASFAIREQKMQEPPFAGRPRYSSETCPVS